MECNLNFACKGELVCQIGKYFVIPVLFKDLLSNLTDLFLKCLVLINKVIKLKVINTVINSK